MKFTEEITFGDDGMFYTKTECSERIVSYSANKKIMENNLFEIIYRVDEKSTLLCYN